MSNGSDLEELSKINTEIIGATGQRDRYYLLGGTSPDVYREMEISLGCLILKRNLLRIKSAKRY
ncbi:MAG TPA: hypothetical protein VMC80_02480 [Patescibacteria group bacterium]|nr:hypothetical protein [Patescibacteria group bacterium]